MEGLVHEHRIERSKTEIFNTTLQSFAWSVKNFNFWPLQAVILYELSVTSRDVRKLLSLITKFMARAEKS